MPIFEIVFSRPLPTALIARASASSRVRSMPSLVDELADRREHQVRVDRGGAVADQHGDALHAARLARLDDEAGLQARPRAHEVVVHRADREQRRDRRALRPDGAVGEDEDVRAARRARRRPRRRCRSSAGSSPSAPSSTGHVMSSVCALKTSESTWRRLSSSSSRRIGLSITSWRACSGVSSSRFRSEPTSDCTAHHDRLADRVDRRVRHLREELLEVGVEQRPPVGEHGERRVVAHRADRLLGVDRERREHHLHVLLRVAERELQPAQRLGRRRAAPARGRSASRTCSRSNHAAYGLRVATSRFTSSSGTMRPCVEVDEEELAGLQPSLAHDLGGRDVEHACLGREHDPAVAGLEPAPGAQPVAVERRADQPPVGERDRRRPVPRLGQALVERVEAAQLVGHVGAPGVRLGHHHHQRVRQRAAGEHEQLEHVVEDRGVRAARPDDRQHLLDVARRRARMRAATRARASS